MFNILRKSLLTSESFLKLLCQRETLRVENNLLASGILTPGKTLADFMKTNRMASKDESVFDVFQRTARHLALAGEKYYGPKQTALRERQFLEYICNFEVIPGSPMLTNAGRNNGKSVSSCSIPALNLSQMTRNEISKIVESYHTRGMGTGFCLDDVTDPEEMVLYLNQTAIQEVQDGKIERSVGNMGVLSIEHPKVLSFIRIKKDNPHIKEWKFNLSVNLTQRFLDAWTSKKRFLLNDGSGVDPEMLMRQIAENAHATGDPGLIFLDRINQCNRTPQVGSYKTVVTCGEVSLFEGEVCQFAYLNLPRFMRGAQIDREGLRSAVHSAVLMLDNAIEANATSMPNAHSAAMISSLRRIGVGVCGFADVLQACGLPYSSEEARELAADVMSFINFESKHASILLAKERGPFSTFDHPETKKELFLEPFAKRPTHFVSAKDWDRLRDLFALHRIRNVATTILPPSGRSSLMAGVTASIEPPFRLTVDRAFERALRRQCYEHKVSSPLDPVLKIAQETGSVQNTDLPQKIKEVFQTALEIPPKNHLQMTAAFQQHIDEGVSKTVNMPKDATVDDVMDIFKSASELGLKGTTIYRNGCRQLQPKPLSKSMDAPNVIDPLYGPISVSGRIARLLDSEPLQRLKSVRQNGAAFLIDPRQSTSRYEHCVGAMALTGVLGGDESAQVAALLHDLSHTAFSHLSDFVFSHARQDYHDLAREKFLQSGPVKAALDACGITERELDSYAFSMVKGPDINVDRLDYCLRDLRAVNRIYQPQYSAILNQLVVEEGEIKCKNLDVARLLFGKFLEVNERVYFDPRAEVATLALGSILKRMLEEGQLTEDDLFSTDEQVLEKIQESRFNPLFQSITPQMAFSISKTPTVHPPVIRKLRYVDPKIAGLTGHLTDHCPESRKRLENYLRTPKTVHYHIPAFKEIL